MSSLITSNISDGTTSVPTGYVVNGSAKAWVNFNGTAFGVRDSNNVSSMTDDGTGLYTVNFSSAFAAANQAMSASSVTGGTVVALALRGTVATTYALLIAAGTGGALDRSDNAAAFHGDLA